jgi:hypothetical protein
MALADYVVQRRDVLDSNGNLVAKVRGLNFEDISQLVRNHIDDLTAVFNSFSEGGKLLPESLDINEMIFRLIIKAPDTAGKMLALGCDEPNEIEKAKTLPAPLQIKLLGEITALTFEDVGGPLEFLAMVRIAVTSQLQVSDAPESSARVIQ